MELRRAGLAVPGCRLGFTRVHVTRHVVVRRYTLTPQLNGADRPSPGETGKGRPASSDCCLLSYGGSVTVISIPLSVTRIVIRMHRGFITVLLIGHGRRLAGRPRPTETPADTGVLAYV